MVRGDKEVNEYLSLENSGVMMFLLGFAKLGENGSLYYREEGKESELLSVSKLARSTREDT